MLQHSPSIVSSFEELEKENRELRLRLFKAENTIRALQGDASNIADGIAKDMAGLKLVEESLRQSEARLETELADTKLLQNISAFLIQEDSVDTLYMKIVEAALTIMQSDFASMQMYYPDLGPEGHLRLLASSGLSEEGKHFWAWVGPHDGTTCAVALRTGKRFIASDMLNCEYIVNTPDHAVFASAGVLAAQSTPLYSRSGRLLGMISTHWTRKHEPSERRLRLLDILARQAADLIERKMAEETLQQNQIALTTADRRKDEFLATLSHELRNPLAPISNAVHLLRADRTGQNTEELLQMMDRQVSHLVRLIDDLLDISRLSQGKIGLRREKITLQTAVQAASETSRPLIDANSHTLALDLPEEPVYLDADLTRIAQIISNLLNNAAKYTPHGGKITISGHREKDSAVLSITDTGVGIPADMLPKVFDLFTQVDHNLNRAQGGLGIGLALVKQLAEMHGGTIKAESAGLDKGSTFTIRLPLASGTHNELPGTDKTTTPAPKLRVLVVDDNEPCGQTTGWMLEMNGHDFKIASDATEALAVVEAYNPDALLLDIGLPGMNGYDLCRALRQNPRFKDTLIIAQTGWGQKRDLENAKEAGFNHHLVKPIDFKLLAELLAGVKPQLM